MSVAWYWLLHVAGIDNPSGQWYAFWSGLGSDITEFAILGGLVSIYVRHTCHVRGCWRLAHRPVEGTGYSACRRHHPEPPPTHAELLRLHRQAKAARVAAAPANVPPAGLTGM